MPAVFEKTQQSSLHMLSQTKHQCKAPLHGNDQDRPNSNLTSLKDLKMRAGLGKDYTDTP